MGEKSEQPPAPAAHPQLPTFLLALGWSLLLLRLFALDTLEVLRAHSVNDYSAFHAAAVAISDGVNPYLAKDLIASAKSVGLDAPHPYLYPPLLAELLIPSSYLQPFIARLLWGLANALALVGSIWLLQVWITKKTANPWAPVVWVIAVASFWPIRESQWMGTANPLVLLGIVVWWTQRESSRWAPLALALAVSVKMSPALLVLVPLTERKWREAVWISALSAVIVGGSCAAMGHHAWDFARQVLTAFAPGARWHDLDVPVDLPNNNSIAAVVARATEAMTPDHMQLLPWAGTLHLAIVAALLAVGAYVTRGDRARTLGMAIALMVVAPTYSWEAHATYMLVPLALVLVEAESIPWAWVVGLAVSWAVMSESVAGFLLPKELDWRWLRTFAHSPKFLPMLVFWAYFCFGARRTVKAAKA